MNTFRMVAPKRAFEESQKALAAECFDALMKRKSGSAKKWKEAQTELGRQWEGGEEMLMEEADSHLALLSFKRHVWRAAREGETQVTVDFDFTKSTSPAKVLAE